MIVVWAVLGVLVLAGLGYGVRRMRRRLRGHISPYTEALAALLDNREDEALTKFRAAVLADSSNLDAYIRLGTLYRRRGDLVRAIQVHQSLLVRKGLPRAQEVRVYEQLGLDYLAARRLQRAALIYEELVRLDRKAIPHYETLLDIYLKTERWEEALNLLKALGKVQKDRHRLALYYGVVGRALLPRDPAQGMNCLKAGLRLEKASPIVLFTLGEHHLNQADPELAVEHWRRLLTQAPQYYFLVIEPLQEAYFQLGKFNQVIPIYERLSKQVPERPEVYLALARLYEKKGDLTRVQEVLDRAAQAVPEDRSLQLYQIGFRLRQGELDQALQDLERFGRELESPQFSCQSCGSVSPQFLWRCPKCGGWECFQPRGG